jgi:uncharacterized protein YoxC
MGAISFSIDVNLAKLVQQELRCELFFESGGFEGDSVAAVKKMFAQIVSVELAPIYAERLRTRFAGSKNVEIVEGDSASVLETTRPKLSALRTLYWLDAHWCDASSVNSSVHQCPLLRELRAMGQLNPHSAVIIDDARLFLAPPLAPHSVADWPTWSQISKEIETNSGFTHEVIVVNDCIVIYPKSMQRAMIDYGQRHGADWLKIADLSREHSVMKAAAEDRLLLIETLDTAAKQSTRAIRDVSEKLDAALAQLRERDAAFATIQTHVAASNGENRKLEVRLHDLQTDLEAKERFIQQTAHNAADAEQRLRLFADERDAARASHSDREASLLERLSALIRDCEAKEVVIQDMSRAAAQAEHRLRALSDAHESAHAALREKEAAFTAHVTTLQSDVQQKEGVIQGLSTAASGLSERLRLLSAAHENAQTELRDQVEVEQGLERVLAERQQALQAANLANEEHLLTIQRQKRAHIDMQQAVARLNVALTDSHAEAQLLREQFAHSRIVDSERHLAAATHIGALEQQLHELRLHADGLAAGVVARANVIAIASGALGTTEQQDAVPLEPAARALLTASAKLWEQHAVEKEAVIQGLVKVVASHQAAADRRATPMRVWRKGKARVLSAIIPKLGVLNQHPPIPLGNRTIVTRRMLPPEALPTMSIVTPSFRQAHLIERTIASVVDQQYPNLQYFVQDGGSDDGTPAVLEKWSLHLTGWESKRDSGQSAAINLGFAKTSGDIMAWLNSDDLLMPGSLNFVAHYFQKHPEVDVLYGDRLLIDEDDALIGRWVLPGHDNAVLPWADFVPQETLFWRREIWDRAGGGIDESFRFAMDWDLLLRFRAAGARFAHVPKYLGAFRIHASQKTSAAISDIGFKEMNRLRLRELGREVDHHEIRKAITPFMARHVLADKISVFRR